MADYPAIAALKAALEELGSDGYQICSNSLRIEGIVQSIVDPLADAAVAEAEQRIAELERTAREQEKTIRHRDYLVWQMREAIQRVLDKSDPDPTTKRDLEDTLGHVDINSAANTEFAKMASRIAELEARVAELTEWRPMVTAPKDGTFLAVEDDGRVYRCESYNASPWSPEAWSGRTRYAIGWLPLPAPPATPDRVRAIIDAEMQKEADHA